VSVKKKGGSFPVPPFFTAALHPPLNPDTVPVFPRCHAGLLFEEAGEGIELLEPQLDSNILSKIPHEKERMAIRFHCGSLHQQV